MNWTRALTYSLAGIAGIVSLLIPVAAPVTTPLAAALAGWATQHPADKASPQAVTNLAVQIAGKKGTK